MRLIVDSAQTEHAELFATALLLEFSAIADSVRLTSCGHPHPYLLRGGKAVELVLEPGAPLGLGFFKLSPPHVRTVLLEPGDRLFLGSDGVTESRDATGAFYPLAERLSLFAHETPSDLTTRLWEDLLHFCDAVRDDVTMLVLTPARSTSRGRRARRQRARPSGPREAVRTGESGQRGQDRVGAAGVRA